jgi:hypothetical protein
VTGNTLRDFSPVHATAGLLFSVPQQGYPEIKSTRSSLVRVTKLLLELPLDGGEKTC